MTANEETTGARLTGRSNCHWSASALACLYLGLSSCAISDPIGEFRASYAAGDYEGAREVLGQLLDDDSGNAHIYALERSITNLALGDPQAAENNLRFARDQLDKLGDNNALQWLSSVLLDDRQLEYGGADYEQVLVRAMLAVANLTTDGQDAYAYALQVLERQLEIMNAYDYQGSQPKLRYKQVAFGSYLRGILNEDDPLRIGVAREAFAKAIELEPGCQAARDAMQRVTNGQHSAKGNGVVHVICMVGRGPFRLEVSEQTSGDVLAIAQAIWADARDRATLPNISSVKIPALAFHHDNPSEVHVAASSAQLTTTEVVTDVEATAQSEFIAMHDQVVARAVLRRAFKIAVTEGVKEVANPRRKNREPRTLGDLGIALAGLLWTAMESADLRCWSLLPATFQVARMELPAGNHTITLRAGQNGRAIGPSQTTRVYVRDGFNTYVVGLVPTMNGGPPPLTSDPIAPETAR